MFKNYSKTNTAGPRPEWRKSCNSRGLNLLSLIFKASVLHPGSQQQKCPRIQEDSLGRSLLGREKKPNSTRGAAEQFSKKKKPLGQ